jgi:hypothetical protein
LIHSPFAGEDRCGLEADRAERGMSQGFSRSSPRHPARWRGQRSPSGARQPADARPRPRRPQVMIGPLHRAVRDEFSRIAPFVTPGTRGWGWVTGQQRAAADPRRLSVNPVRRQMAKTDSRCPPSWTRPRRNSSTSTLARNEDLALVTEELSWRTGDPGGGRANGPSLTRWPRVLPYSPSSPSWPRRISPSGR